MCSVLLMWHFLALLVKGKGVKVIFDWYEFRLLHLSFLLQPLTRFFELIPRGRVKIVTFLTPHIHCVFASYYAHCSVFYAWHIFPSSSSCFYSPCLLHQVLLPVVLSLKFLNIVVSVITLIMGYLRVIVVVFVEWLLPFLVWDACRGNKCWAFD